jgi:hypothetical protein
MHHNEDRRVRVASDPNMSIGATPVVVMVVRSASPVRTPGLVELQKLMSTAVDQPMLDAWHVTTV